MFKRIILIKYIVLMSSVFGENNPSPLTLNGFSSSGSEQVIRFSNPGYNISNNTLASPLFFPDTTTKYTLISSC